jgi:hypothetical protein
MLILVPMFAFGRGFSGTKSSKSVIYFVLDFLVVLIVFVEIKLYLRIDFFGLI